MSHSDSNFYKSFAFVLGALVLFTLFIMYIANTLSPAAAEDPLALAAQQKSIQPIGRSRVVGGDAALTAARAPEPAKEVAPATVEVAEEVSAEETKAEKTEEPVTEEPVAEKTEKPATEKVVETQVVESKTTETQTAQAVTATSAAAVSANTASLKVKATVATNCAGCHNVSLNGAAKPDDAQAWTALADKGIEALTMSVINGKGKMPARAESNLSDKEITEAIHLMIAKATDGKVVAGAAK